MTWGGRGRSRRTHTQTAPDHLAGVTGLVGAVAALIAAVAGLLTAAATLLVNR
ncbi:hypothetical protein JOD64_005374 [Micromonospora luteifusca]|uniref:Uncharacterized protein n=1 Tax=Micromonospora luteifusca TaxID=709860 RepID=A0ABS2M1U7_9ACTN|nr:hypothetical protein [Micromonospora luteifusca]MBM7494152.1 hypothetical protein [Micromonospora luteifusca]